MQVSINDKERDTILAGLRLLQWASEAHWPALQHTSRGQLILEIASNGRTGSDAALRPAEIDALCARINTHGDAT
jgi:hypothetical protein